MLHVVHSYKVIINDFKPGNILISPEGIMKFSDMGSIALKLHVQTVQKAENSE